MSVDPQTVVFWGAGATYSIGLPITGDQAKFLRALAPGVDGQHEDIRTRVRNALGHPTADRWVDAFSIC